jgi:hypothetical protein
MELTETNRGVPIIVLNGQTSVGVAIVGRPVEIDFQGLPPGATFTLTGLKNGVQFGVPITADGGEIDISRELLAQFDFPDRVSLTVGNVTPGQYFLQIGGNQTRLYDDSSDLQSVARSVTATAQGFGALVAIDGRAEAFDLDGYSPAAANATFALLITPAMGVNLAGIAGAVRTGRRELRDPEPCP